MERRYYSSESLSVGLAELEERFGLSSEAFYERYSADPDGVGVPWTIASLWCSLIEERARVVSIEADVAGSVSRALAVV